MRARRRRRNREAETIAAVVESARVLERAAAALEAAQANIDASFIDSHSYCLLLDRMADLYRRYKGEEPHVERLPDGTYGGPFYEVVRIVTRAAARANDEIPQSDAELGRMLAGRFPPPAGRS